MPAINRPTPTVSVPSGRGMRLVFVGCGAEIDDVGREVVEILITRNAQVARSRRRDGVVGARVGADAVHHVIGNETGLAGHP